MRALLVVNPKATTTTARTKDVIVHALSHDLDLDVVTTERRGHATEVAAAARRNGLAAVIALGGDGTINEVINGLLADGVDDDVPLLGAVPGGSANVFVRALGMPADPVEATGALLEAIADKRTRQIGLGTAQFAGQHRWFAFNAGIGIDAEIIESMERQRARGATATPSRYLATTVRQFFARTDRRTPALTLSRPGVPDVAGVHFAFIQNTSPWTFLGPVPIEPCPNASFETGLDLFAPRTMALLPSLHNVRKMVIPTKSNASARRLLALHDQSVLQLTASRPIPLQVDGDACGSVQDVLLRSIPSAIHVLM